MEVGHHSQTASMTAASATTWFSVKIVISQQCFSRVGLKRLHQNPPGCSAHEQIPGQRPKCMRCEFLRIKSEKLRFQEAPRRCVCTVMPETPRDAGWNQLPLLPTSPLDSYTSTNDYAEASSGFSPVPSRGSRHHFTVSRLCPRGSL